MHEHDEPRERLTSAIDDLLSDALAEVARGDAAAFEFVYQLGWSPIRARALAVVRDGDLADEVAQDVLLEVWMKAGAFSAAAGSALSWMLTITHHRAVDLVRSVSASRRREREDFARPLPLDTSSDPVADLVLGTDRASLGRSLDALTRAQRQAVEMAFFEGCTHPQVAQRLGVPLGTVKSRIRDGLIVMARSLRHVQERAGAEG